MRQTTLGSHSQHSKNSKKEMEKPKEQKLVKQEPQESNSAIYLAMPAQQFEWRIHVLGKIMALTAWQSQSDLMTRESYEPDNRGQEGLIQLSQDKITKVLSLTSYLSQPHQLHFMQNQASFASLLHFICQMFGHGLAYLQKNTDIAQLQKSQIQSPELLRMCRGKKILCFSSLWRCFHKVIYVMVHRFEGFKKQKRSMRVHLLDCRGLIMQTLTNLSPETYVVQVLVHVKKHYTKMQNMVWVNPEGSEVFHDTFEALLTDRGSIRVAMINFNSRASLNKLTQISQSKSYKDHACNEGVLQVYQGRQLLVWHNYSSKEQLVSYLRRVKDIVIHQSRIVGHLAGIDYFGVEFNQKESMLRLFAFIFNFGTLKPMLSDSKETLLDKLIESEQSSFMSMEQERPKIVEGLKSHTISNHVSYLVCLICRKRTKTHCEKCAWEFNRYFGVCAKQCFKTFHADIEKYMQTVRRTKKLVDPALENSALPRQDQQHQSGLQGRKKVKKDQKHYEDHHDESDRVQDRPDPKLKWTAFLADQSQQYKILQRYSAAQLLPPMTLKKCDYIFARTPKLNFSSQIALVSPNQVKKEQL